MKGYNMKVSLFNKRVLKTFDSIATWALALFSIIIIFMPVTEEYKWYVLCGLVLLHILIYLGVWICYNKTKSVTIKIRNTKIIIKEGDLFAEKGKKVIAFNEYFDTQIDDVIIAKGSLNGIFVTEHISDVASLDRHISDFLSKRKPALVDEQRSGKKIQYNLGTIVPYEDYYLLAYSRFDKNNCAFLENDDIAKVYLKMWSEIDILKACNSICMPVLGSSRIVRNMDYTPQQLLELLLWSFRISGVNMTRSASITIVVHKTMIDDIDFLKLQDYSD